MFGAVRNPKMWKPLIGKLSFGFSFSRKLHSLKTIEIPNLFLEEMIWRNLGKWPNKTAMVCAETKRSYTYQELYNKSNSIASFLHKLGMSKDDTVAIMLPNIPEYPIVFLGAVQAGVKVTPLNPLFTPDEIHKQLIQSVCKLMFTTYELHGVVIQALQMARLHIPIVTVRIQQNSQLPNEAIDFKEIVLPPTASFASTHPRDTNDTIIIPFSSGTTGPPKGVEITHKNIVSNLHQACSDEFDIFAEANGSEQDVIPLVLPMFHMYGLGYLMLHGLVKGCQLVTVPKFTSAMFIHILEKYHPTVLCTVPSILHMILSNEQIKRSHFKQTRTIMCAAAPLGKSYLSILRKKTGQEDVVQGYGLTEATIVTHIHSPIFKGGFKQGGVGLLVPSKIILADDGSEVGANKTGEIVIRGPQVMKGYYKNKKATKDALTNDGWLKTGDVAYYDDDGHFFITGRSKELIKVKGYQVAPTELEDLLRELPAVADVAAVGVPHEEKLQKPL